MKPKFNYQSYDYSFLQPKASVWWSTYMPQAVQVSAQTIGFDMTPVEPMNQKSFDSLKIILPAHKDLEL